MSTETLKEHIHNSCYVWWIIIVSIFHIRMFCPSWTYVDTGEIFYSPIQKCMLTHILQQSSQSCTWVRDIYCRLLDYATLGRLFLKKKGKCTTGSLVMLSLVHTNKHTVNSTLIIMYIKLCEIKQRKITTHNGMPTKTAWKIYRSI